MEDPIDFIGLVVIGAVLAAPLLYGLSTLLGMTHKQFRPILRQNRPDGATVPVVHGQPEPSIEQHALMHDKGGDKW